jgi:putative endonuclease
LERNYHFEKAEVDIVAYDNQRFIFVEVKTRRGISFEAAEEQLSPEQFKRVMKAGQAWLYERKMEGAPVRFDLITVLLKDASPIVQHYKNAGNDLQQFR